MTEPKRPRVSTESATGRTRKVPSSARREASDANPGDTLTYSATNLPNGSRSTPAPVSSRHTLRYQLRQLRGRPHRQRRHPQRHRLLTWTSQSRRNVAPASAPSHGSRGCRRRGHQLRRQRLGCQPGDTLTYSATNLPDGISINPSTGVVSGTLSGTSSGSYAVVLTVSDGSLTDTDSFTWTVTEAAANVAPVFSTEFTDRTDAEGAVISGFDADATDPNPATPLTYSATNLPAGSASTPSTGVVERHPQCHVSAGVLRGCPDRQRRHAHRHRLVHLDRDRAGRQRGPGLQHRVHRPHRSRRRPHQLRRRTRPMPDPGDTLTYSATNLPDGISINA